MASWHRTATHGDGGTAAEQEQDRAALDEVWQRLGFANEQVARNWLREQDERDVERYVGG